MENKTTGKDYRGGYEITLQEPSQFSEYKYQLQIVTGITDDDYDEEIHINMSKEELLSLRNLINKFIKE